MIDSAPTVGLRVSEHDAGDDYVRCNALLRPVVELLRNVGFRAKAAVIATAFLVPIAVLAWNYVDAKSGSLRDTAAEREGVAFTRALLPAIKHARQVRRFALLEASSGASSSQLAEVSAKLTADLAAVKVEDVRLGDAFGTHGSVAALDAAVQAADTPGAGVNKVFASHGKLNDALLTVLGKVVDGSGLTLDPDLDTFYLMDAALLATPQLLEATARLRVLAAATATTGQGGVVAAVELGREDGLSDYVAGQVWSDLSKVVGVHAEMKEALDTDAALKKVASLRDLAGSDPGAGGAEKSKAIDQAGAAVVDSLEPLQLKALDALDQLLAARQSAVRHQITTTSAVVAIFVCGAGVLFYAFSLVINQGLTEVARHLKHIAGGDLSKRPNPRGKDETAALLGSVAEMQLSLNRIVSEVRSGSDSIAQASAQIAAGAQDLSDRTEQTAANVEKSASSMEQISSTVKNTADHAQEATRLATSNASSATRGGQVINEMIRTMDDIRTSSSKIGDIISVIDGIAFQTNILALNAAVEAARAGEAGRGFAVVATEVRALAQRSASAAREIKALISASVEKVEAGTGIVRDAGQTMDEIVGSSQEVHRLLGQIATGAREQTQGVDQVGQGISELDRTTQGNAALVEETAAAAASLRDLARSLSLEVARFKVSA